MSAALVLSSIPDVSDRRPWKPARLLSWVPISARTVDLGQGRLGSGQSGDRDPERRAADVVEPVLVAPGDRGRVAAVLAADADLDPGPRSSGRGHGDLDQPAYPVGVEGGEGVCS